MGKIFESPDKGKTVYSREAGQTERTLHSMAPELQGILAEIQAERMWATILKEAKTNITLQDALDRVIMIYNISKEYKDGI